MPHPRTADLAALIRALVDAGVESIIVGGAAAVIHGAPVTTLDLDIVPDQSPENLARLLSALDGLGARFRPILPGPDIAPTAEHVAGTGQLDLTTRDGPLDVLCRLLIAIKASTGRAKDQLVVGLLRAVAEGNEGDGR